jgi:hypothetical protein
MKITVVQAATMLECQERAVQGMVRAGYFGAYIVRDGKRRGSYYITSEQVERFKEGEKSEEKNSND